MMDRLLAEAFGHNLRRHRRRAGLTQVEVADIAELHRVAVGEMERGQRMPRADTILKVAAAVDVSACALLVGLRWWPGHYVAGRFDVGAGGLGQREAGSNSPKAH